MTRPSCASVDAIRPVCDAVRAIVWPIDRSQWLAAAAQLGWEVKIDIRTGVYFSTPLTTSSKPNAIALVADDAVAKLTVDLSDPTASPQQLAAWNIESTQRVAEILGPPDGVDVGTYWELENGGRITVQPLNNTVGMIVLQKTFADIERTEERLGVGTDRIPERTDEDE